MPSLAVLALFKEYQRTATQAVSATKIQSEKFFKAFKASADLVSLKHFRLIFSPGYMSDFLKKVPQFRHS